MTQIATNLQPITDDNGDFAGFKRTDTGAENLVPREVVDAKGNTLGLVGLPASLPPMRAMVFGNSIANQSKYNSAANAKYLGNGFSSAVLEFNALMLNAFVFDDTGDSTIGGQALVQGVWGYSGATSSDMVSHLAECLAAYRPGVVFLHLFENDITNLTLADSYANLKTALRACKDAGAVPVVFTCLPSLSFTTTAHRDYYAQLNDLIFTECAKQAGALAVDVSGAYMDTADTYPQPLAGYTDASVHPLRKANVLLGRWIYDQIGALFPKRKHRVVGKTDGNEILSAIPNPCMYGTGGTAGTGITGDVPASWSAIASGTGNSAVLSKVADGTKESLNIAGTFTGSTTVANTNDSVSVYNANATTGFAVGDKVYMEVEVEITGTPVALKSLYGYLNMTGTSEVLYTLGYQATADVGLGGVWPSTRQVLRSAIYAIPPGTTGVRSYVTAKYVVGVADASVNFIVHSAVVRKVPFAEA